MDYLKAVLALLSFGMLFSRDCLGADKPNIVLIFADTDRGSKTSQRLIPVPNKNSLAAEVVTLAEALRSAG